MEPIYDLFRKFSSRMSEWMIAYNQLPLRQRLIRLALVWVVFFVISLRRRVSGAASTAKAAPAVAKKLIWAPFSDFLTAVDEGKVAEVIFGDDDVVEYALKATGDVATTAAAVNEVRVTRRVPSHLMPLVNSLRSKDVKFGQVTHPLVSASTETPLWQSVVVLLIPAAYISLLGFILYRFFGPDSLGSSNVGDRAGAKKPKRVTRFEDVAGTEEAREAVREVCDILKDPAKYEKAGARLPSGILLVGPPGTGKTMLARAMANDAGLPFFYCSGSDFVEIYAGRGAARVRALFQKAEKAAPAVVFIDEIDALGGSRHLGPTNNEEREQTLNQLLSCMDGFDSDRRVVVIAATNRFDYLDKALVRPGRFDRIVRVDLPDAEGRKAILQVHTRDMLLAPGVDLGKVARECSGYSGAELASLCNEAAIRAVRRGRDTIKADDFAEALNEFNESRNRGKSAKRRDADNDRGWRSLFQRMGLDRPDEAQGAPQEDDEEEEGKQPQSVDVD